MGSFVDRNVHFLKYVASLMDRSVPLFRSKMFLSDQCVPAGPKRPYWAEALLLSQTVVFDGPKSSYRTVAFQLNYSVPVAKSRNPLDYVEPREKRVYVAAQRVSMRKR